MSEQEARDDEAVAALNAALTRGGGGAAREKALHDAANLARSALLARKHPEPSRDDEREALVRRAREVSGALEEYEFEGAAGEAAGLLNSLADTLARKHPEPEWEYGVGWRYQSIIAGFGMESAEAAAAHVSAVPDDDDDEVEHFVVRRLPERPAGPWLPVGEGEK